MLPTTARVRWTPAEDAILESLWGLARPATLLAALRAVGGPVRTFDAVKNRTSEIGLHAWEARGQITIKAAARSFGVDHTTLMNTIEQTGIKPHGRQRYRLLDERQMACLAAIYPALPGPVVDLSTAAHLLRMPTRHVRRLALAGELHGRPFGLRAWHFPIREIERMKVAEAFRAEPVVPAAIAPLLGTYVAARGSLLAVTRQDLTLVVPAPQRDRKTYRAGQVLGRAVGHLGELLVVETLFGRVLVQRDDVEAERHEPAARRVA